MFKLEPEFFGLDISDFSLRFAKIDKKKEGLELVSFGQEEIPVGVIKEGEVKDEDKLAGIIKNCLKENKGEKFKTKYVVSSLPEEKSFLDIIQLPLMKEEEIETAVRYEIENHIPLALDKVYFDFQKIEPTLKYNKNYQEVLIAATPKTTVEGYLKALKKAGLKPLALEVESLAVVRALIKKTALLGSLLIIDFGGSRTSFIIYSGKSIRFTSSSPFSSSDLTRALSRDFKISFKSAERLKIKNGLEGEKEVAKVLTPLLDKFSETIKTHLDYYYRNGKQTSHEKVKPGKILLCGGGVNLKGLPEFLCSKLNIDVKISNPLFNILKRLNLSSKESLGYTTALGLALKNFYDN